MRSGYFHFGNNHVSIQFASLKLLFQMLADIRHSDIKQLSHCLLRSPNRLILDDYLYLTLLFGQLV